MSKATGTKFERLVRSSAKRQKLRLRQTGPRAIGTGKTDAAGRPISKHVESGFLDFLIDTPGGFAEFDAKSTKGKSLPLANLKRNQVTIVRRAHEAGRLAFFLVEFSALPDGPEYYVLPWPVLALFWSNTTTGVGPMSIPLAVFRDLCPRVQFVGKKLDLADIIERLGRAAA